MLWLKAFHIIALVAWFSGLFYLPRLFVYHAQTHDPISHERFTIMERKLYTYIMTPAAWITVILGATLVSLHPKAYHGVLWLPIKIALVFAVILFHLYCGRILRRFHANDNPHSSTFYRVLNEVPTVLLATIVILAVVKPF